MAGTWSSLDQQELKALIGPLGKLDRLPSKKTCFQQQNGTVQTGFRGGPILSLPLLFHTISTAGIEARTAIYYGKS